MCAVVIEEDSSVEQERVKTDPSPHPCVPGSDTRVPIPMASSSLCDSLCATELLHVIKLAVRYSG